MDTDVISTVVQLVASLAGLAVASLGVFLAGRTSRAAEKSAQRARVALFSAIEIADATPERAVSATAERLQENLDESVSDRIDQAAKSLRESGLLVAELQSELAARTAAIARLRAQEEESRRLAALSENEARAVKDLIGRVIDSAHEGIRDRLEQERAELRGQLAEVQTALEAAQASGRRDQIRFFLLGVLVSIPIGILVNLFF